MSETIEAIEREIDRLRAELTKVEAALFAAEKKREDAYADFAKRDDAARRIKPPYLEENMTWSARARISDA